MMEQQQPHNWTRWMVMGELHIVPANDLKVHEIARCWCQPCVYRRNGVLTVSHNAADAREFFERPGERGH